MLTPHLFLKRSHRLTALAVVLVTASVVTAEASEVSGAATDSSLTLTGDAEGSVLRSLTIEGDNRIQFDFERPDLVIDLDPAQAPGLVWGDAQDVLDRTVPDRFGPLLDLSIAGLSPYRPQPWRAEFRSGPVARFRPQTAGVERWELSVVDARGEVVREFSGEKRVPDEIVWDGRNAQGAPVILGLTYSYVFTAYDRAGNCKRYVGDGFQLPPFRLDSDAGPVLVFPGDRLGAGATRGAKDVTPPLVAEVASWLNRSLGPDDLILVTATAPSGAVGEALGARLRDALLPLIPGDPARVLVRVEVEAGVPAAGSLRVEPGGDATAAAHPDEEVGES